MLFGILLHMPRKAVSKKSTRKVPARNYKKVSMPVMAEKRTSPSSNTLLREKIKNPKLLIGIAVVIILLTLLYFFRSQFVVAIVNGRLISRMAFNSQLEQQNGKQVLSTMITAVLLEQEAQKKHISVSQSELDNQVKQINTQLSQQGQTLDSALAQRGMTKAQFYDQLKLQALVQKLLGSNIKVSDKEVDDYIAAHQDTIDPNAKPEDTRASIRQQLEQQKLSTQAQSLIAKLQQQAHITYFVNL